MALFHDVAGASVSALVLSRTKGCFLALPCVEVTGSKWCEKRLLLFNLTHHALHRKGKQWDVCHVVTYSCVLPSKFGDVTQSCTYDWKMLAMTSGNKCQT